MASETSEPVLNLSYSLKRKETDDSDFDFLNSHSARTKKKKTNTTQGGQPERLKDSKTPSLKKQKHEKSDQKKPAVHKQRLATFSSVFRCNPEIPEVQSVEVTKVKEDVFSKDSFQSLGLHKHLVSNLEEKLKLTTMTAVQKATIPRILEGRDVLVKSQTGSGKTLSYAIPIVQHLQGHSPKVKRSDGPYAIVIVPTRELALQSFEVIRKLVSPFVWIVPGSIMGGERKKSEKGRLRKGINILVSTPGRLLDHFDNTHSLTLSHIRWLVIDEADRLLDLGFEKEVSRIISYLDEKMTNQRQTVLLSATLSQGVERLAGMSLQDPLKIDISEATVKPSEDASRISVDNKSAAEAETFATPESLKHHFVIVPSKVRLVTLAAFLLWQHKFSSMKGKIIVFVSTQDSVEFHNTIIQNVLKSSRDTDSDVDVSDDDDEDRVGGSGPAAGKTEDDLMMFKLHGDMPQKERTQVFQDFCLTDSGVLFCTDVAARGLDLPHIRWILQYNAPESTTDYIHRVGRTARMGSQGQALLFLTPSEVEYVKVLGRFNISIQEMKMDDILKSTVLFARQRLLEEGKKARRLTVQESATQLQIMFEEQTQNKKEMRTLARKAYQSVVRAYATYPSEMKHIFHVKYLHLGHVAKSFALQDAPKHIGGIITKHAKFKREKSHDWRSSDSSTKKSFKRKPAVSEYSSGLDGILQKPKLKQKHKQKQKKQKLKK